MKAVKHARKRYSFGFGVSLGLFLLPGCSSPAGEVDEPANQASEESSENIEKSTAAALSAHQVPGVIDALIATAPEGQTLHIRHKMICGFVVPKRVAIDGHGVQVVACPSAPSPIASANDLKAGVLLDAAASGSQLQGFVFQGKGASSGEVGALAFGVFSRGAEDVVITRNHFWGTVQAITTVGGKGWVITKNRIRDLEVFGCPGHCAGGVGIVLAHSPATVASSSGALVWKNRITAVEPPSGLLFSVTGILAWSTERASVLRNRVSLKGSPTRGIDVTRTAQAGMVIEAACGGARILENRARAEEPIRVDPACMEGTITLDNREVTTSEALVASWSRDAVQSDTHSEVSPLRQAPPVARPLGL